MIQLLLHVHFDLPIIAGFGHVTGQHPGGGQGHAHGSGGQQGRGGQHFGGHIGGDTTSAIFLQHGGGL